MSLRDALRQATRTHHQLMHEHPLLAGLLHPDYPLAHYLAVIQGFYAFYRDIEPPLARFPLEDPDFQYRDRLKLPWLEQDLGYFGQEGVPHPGPGPALDTVEAFVGTLYVIEGSSQGGRAIARSLQRHLGLGPDRGGRFYHGYGPDTDRRWQEFQGLLERLGPRLDPGATVAAAAAAFHHALRCLGEGPEDPGRWEKAPPAGAGPGADPGADPGAA